MRGGNIAGAPVYTFLPIILFRFIYLYYFVVFVLYLFFYEAYERQNAWGNKIHPLTCLYYLKLTKL